MEKTTPNGALGWGRDRVALSGLWERDPGYKVECARGWGC